MMFTCSALRCSVLEGSAISGTSDDPGAHDPPAPTGIPDAALYVTGDDEAFAHMVRDLEHATDLSLDSARHVRRTTTADLAVPTISRSPLSSVRLPRC